MFQTMREMAKQAQSERIEIRPQPKQIRFLSNQADIVIGGGAAGGGKTFSLLIEPLRHVNKSGFNAVLLRRTYPEIVKPGGIWEEAEKMYAPLGGVSNLSLMRWTVGKAKISFGSILNDQALENWKSTQAELILWDQLETFTEKMFFYMGSRNRGTSGVKSYQRATANPQPGWLADLIDWWLADDGYANMERVGIPRAFIRVDGEIVWADTKQELIDKFGKDANPKTLTYIPFTVYDNPILLEKDPGYVASLKAMGLVDRMRLLGDPERGGNWKVKPSTGKVFNRDWFEIVEDVPLDGLRVRYFDLAATEVNKKNKDPDYTCGIEMIYKEGFYYVTHMLMNRYSPAETDKAIDNLIFSDVARVVYNGRYMARWEIEPGSASKRDSVARTQRLAGIDAKGVRKDKAKLIAWKPLAAAAEAGIVKILKGNWNETFLNQMHGVPDLPHDDVADAAAGAFQELVKENTVKLVAKQRRY